MRRPRIAALALSVVLGTAGCAPGASPGTASPTPTAQPTAAVPSGPASLGDWTALQGFGGGSGIVGLARAPRFLREHLSDPGFDLASWAEIADGLVRWLEDRQPTPCWAAYHEALLEQLRLVDADFEALVALADAGKPLTTALIDQLDADVTAANAIATPAACD